MLDLQEGSPTYGQLVGRVHMPQIGDELHHFGWSACSSALCPWAPHPHVERRYLLVPGLHSSRIHVVDVEDDPHAPKIVKVIEAAEIARKTGYAARRRLEDRDLILHAGGLGLDAERVACELHLHSHLARVERDLSSARRAGLRGTPTFYVNGQRFDGRYDTLSLVDALREET